MKLRPKLIIKDIQYSIRTSAQYYCCYSVAMSSLTLWDPMEARLLCSSLSPRVWSNSCPLVQWCHLTISSSVTPFSFCHQTLPVSGYFPMSQLFSSSSQNIGASVLVLPMDIQGWLHLGLSILISLLRKEISRVFSSTIIQKHQFSGFQLSLWSDSHIYTWLLKNHSITLTLQAFVGKVMSLLFNKLSRLNIMWQPKWEKNLKRNRDMCMYSLITFLFTWNYHNIVNYTPI